MSQAEELAKLVRTSNSTVFFGGAGVSTESGIPDFRSEGGLHHAKNNYGYTPEELLSRSLFTQKPELFFKYYKENLVSTAKPNAAHIALAMLEQRGLLDAVITQNIDGLHQAAGSNNVLELHGTGHRHYCTKCRAIYDSSYSLDETNCEEGVPRCNRCHRGIVHPAVVLYEEGLDEDVLHEAIHALSHAELLIVGGTSLVVYPAAGLLRFFGTEARNKPLGVVVINKAATHADYTAKLVILESIGQTLSIVERSV